MKVEYFDVVNDKDNIIGKASRQECHSNPKLIHRGVFIIVTNEKEEILLSKRSMQKDTKPGVWEFPAGHNDLGESYKNAAKRELKEEVGIAAKIKKIGKILAKPGYETEFDEIFLGRVKSNVKLVLDKKEVSETRWISVPNLKKELANDRKTFTTCFSVVFNEYLRYCKKPI
ncbi:MAG: NUDIX domain-containing protein [Candidatus Aenigmatarchaeota archaeon]